MGVEQELVHDILVGERFLWSVRKLLVLAFGALAAYALLASPAVAGAIAGLGALAWLGVFIAGLLFAYGATTLPAISALFLLAKDLPPVELALLAALGAALSDAALFHVARGSLRHEFLQRLFHLHPHLGRGSHRALRAVSPLIAGLILASPVPDEVAAAVFGSMRYSPRKFIALSYAFKFFAVLAIASAARLV